MTPKSVFFSCNRLLLRNFLIELTFNSYSHWCLFFLKENGFFWFLGMIFQHGNRRNVGYGTMETSLLMLPKFQHNQNETLFRAMLFCVSTQKCQQEVTPQKWLWRHRCTDVATLLKLRFWYNDMTTPCDFPANNMAWWSNSKHHG